MIHFGDCKDIMQTWPDQSVNCCVTSPPYFGLRDYGHAGQIGLESSPAEFVAKLVEVFREVRRVLRHDGTCWINMGDSYAGSWGAQGRPNGESGQMAGRSVISARQIHAHPRFQANTGTVGKDWGLKPKDKMLIPHRLAIALCDDGWYVRDDIVWTVTTKPFKGAHFATFPPDLIEPCILAGCPVGGTVLDPFMGSGTTAQVAILHSRQYIGCELNPAYKELQDQRIADAMDQKRQVEMEI
jgi:DNA modification methylase